MPPVTFSPCLLEPLAVATIACPAVGKIDTPSPEVVVIDSPTPETDPPQSCIPGPVEPPANSRPAPPPTPPDPMIPYPPVPPWQ